MCVLQAKQAAQHPWLASKMIDVTGASEANRRATLNDGVTAAEIEETRETLVTSTHAHPVYPLRLSG